VQETSSARRWRAGDADNYRIFHAFLSRQKGSSAGFLIPDEDFRHFHGFGLVADDIHSGRLSRY
jgi:hypothetical protein